MTNPKTVDELLIRYGDPGRYQVLIYIMTWLATCQMSFNNFVALFTVSYYPHRCKLPEDWKWPVNESIPASENDEQLLDSCKMYRNPDNKTEGTTTCIYGWEHITPRKEWTIVQEWDLVCGEEYLAPFSISCYYLGILVGCIVFGILADKFGRKTILLMSTYLQIAIGVGMAYASSYKMYVILRGFHGFVIQGIGATGGLLGMEIFQPARRNVLAIGSQILWPCMLCTLTLISWAVGNWRHIHLAISLPFLFTIAYIWFLPESIRWLLVEQKLGRAKEEIKRLARYNKVPVPANLSNQLKFITLGIQEGPRRKSLRSSLSLHSEDEHSFLHLLKTLVRGRRMKIVLFTTVFVWGIVLLIYWSVSYSMPKLGGSAHINFLVSGIFEIFLSLAMYFVLQRVGRRKICFVVMIISGIINASTVAFQLLDPQSPQTTSMSIQFILFATLAALGRTTIAIYFCALPMYTNELYPTKVRSFAYGLAMFSGRVGTIVAPYIVLMEHSIWRPLPRILCAALSIIAAVSVLILPETLNKPLPEVPEDLEKLWKNAPDITKKRRQSENEERESKNLWVSRHNSIASRESVKSAAKCQEMAPLASINSL